MCSLCYCRFVIVLTIFFGKDSDTFDITSFIASIFLFDTRIAMYLPLLCSVNTVLLAWLWRDTAVSTSQYKTFSRLSIFFDIYFQLYQELATKTIQHVLLFSLCCGLCYIVLFYAVCYNTLGDTVLNPAARCISIDNGFYSLSYTIIYPLATFLLLLGATIRLWDVLLNIFPLQGIIFFVHDAF